MKFADFAIEFTKALKNKDNVRVLDLILQDPWEARACVHKDFTVRTLFEGDFLKDNPYVRMIFSEKNADESISAATSIVRETFKGRVFNIATPRKGLAHTSVDYFHKRNGMIQTKTVKGWDYLLDFSARGKYKPTIHTVEIDTKETDLITTNQTRPKINIHGPNDREPISRQEIEYLLKEIDKKHIEIGEMIQTKMDPLLAVHKEFFDDPGNKGIDLLAQNPRFNHKNQFKNEFDFRLHKFRMTPDIKFEKKMTIRQDISVQKNVENFKDILSTFFEKKELTLYNYLPEFYKLNTAIQNNFKELKFILSKQENLEKIDRYFHEWKLELLEEETDNVGDDMLLLKKIHCYNLLRYLETKRKKEQKSSFKQVYKGFFKNFDDVVYEYFRGKR